MEVSKQASNKQEIAQVKKKKTKIKLPEAPRPSTSTSSSSSSSASTSSSSSSSNNSSNIDPSKKREPSPPPMEGVDPETQKKILERRSRTWKSQGGGPAGLRPAPGLSGLNSGMMKSTSSVAANHSECKMKEAQLKQELVNQQRQIEELSTTIKRMEQKMMMQNAIIKKLQQTRAGGSDGDGDDGPGPFMPNAPSQLALQLRERHPANSSPFSRGGGDGGGGGGGGGPTAETFSLLRERLEQMGPSVKQDRLRQLLLQKQQEMQNNYYN